MFPKPVWKIALGKERKTRHLILKASKDVSFAPFLNVIAFKSERGCRKHVFTEYGWYYFFHKNSDLHEVFPALLTRGNSPLKEIRRVTSSIPCFSKTCITVMFKNLLETQVRSCVEL